PGQTQAGDQGQQHGATEHGEHPGGRYGQDGAAGTCTKRPPFSRLRAILEANTPARGLSRAGRDEVVGWWGGGVVGWWGGGAVPPGAQAGGLAVRITSHHPTTPPHAGGRPAVGRAARRASGS